MTTFNILHLTDLHYGLKGQDGLFSSVRTDFFDDLERLQDRCGSFDLVLFTGDLTQSGSKDEYSGLEELLDELKGRLRTNSSLEPVLLAVPGNHDLVRPDPNLPEVLVLKDLAGVVGRERVWEELLYNPDSRYRQMIDSAFMNYKVWWESRLRRYENRDDFFFHAGVLPGDFSAILEKAGTRLGVVGLNVTFLQLTAGDYMGKLAVDPRQFIKACEGKGDTWFKDNIDSCVLMTHQPPNWLAPSNRREVYDALIDRAGRFAAQFCGHMHEPLAEARSQGWSQSRRLSLGGSLFGLETDAEGVSQRIHAYAACRIELPEDAKEGTIRIWPRRAIRRASNVLEFDRDQSFVPDPELRDEGTQPQSFPLLRKQSRSRKETAPGRNETEAPLTTPPLPTRPYVGKLPVLDPQAQFRLHFIGRENLLRDFDDALDGLLVRANRNEVMWGRRGGEVQLFWIHGFGGMGKSWFLRKACAEVELRTPTPTVALIDWHLPDWHLPASTPPDNPRELFSAVAYRLAQIYGVERLDTFWEAERRVAASWERHRQLHDELDETLSLLQSYGPNALEILTRQAAPSGLLEGGGVIFKRLRRLEQLLRERKQWSDNPAKHSKLLKEQRARQLRYDNADPGLFESWAEEIASGEDDAVKRPSALLADTLRDCIRALSTSDMPLVLILDTCELLSPPLDAWLRRLLCPLLDGCTPLLVLAGSRQRPDPYLTPGQKGGWRDSVDALRLRIVPFDEAVRFTVAELDEALDRAALARPDRPLPSEPDFGSLLHRVTLGVPLAWGTLLGLHWGDPPDNVLFELSSLDWNSADELDQNRAARKVIEVVAGRFLLHLENQPEVTDDLHDITALAVLRRANSDILGKYWETDSSTDRLRTLSQQYALMADGDLHPTVREYLRRHWHNEPANRIKQVALELMEALEKVSPDDGMSDDPARYYLELERLNLLAWIRDEDAYPDFIRSLVTSMAAGRNTSELLDLALEIKPTRPRGQKIHEMLATTEWGAYQYSWAGSDMLEALSWLEKQRTDQWTELEKASLDLVGAYILTANGRHGEAVARFERATDSFGSAIPEPNVVARAYFRSMKEMDGESVKSAAERAHKWAESLGLNFIDEWDEGYYWTLHNAQKYEEAESYCRKIIETEPDNDIPRAFLGHILGSHLNRSEEAEQVYLAGLQTDEESANLHFFYGQLLSDNRRFAEAEKEYKRALEFVSYSKKDKAAVLNYLGSTLESLNRKKEAREAWQEMLASNPNDAETLNLLAWNIYRTMEDLDEAEKLARRSMSLRPDALHILHTLSAILIRRGMWADAAPLYRRWVTHKGAEDFKQRWEEYLPQLSDAVKQGQAAAMADLLEGKKDHPLWSLLRAVLRAIAEGRSECPELPEHMKDAAATLFHQILSSDPSPSFPDIE